MSSMRNAVQRRNHKERAQPLERAKWGLLEKRKDYTLRAADHKQKKRKLNALKQKASERNDDEFYFGMMSNSSKGGVKVAKRGEENSGGVGGAGRSLSVEVVRLMKTQDVAYLRTVLQSTVRERERLGREVVVLEEGVDVQREGRNKVVFGDDGEAIAAYPSPPRDDDDDLADLDGLDDLEGMDEDGISEPEEPNAAKPMTKEEKAAAKRKRHTLDVKRRKLEGLQERAEDLTIALRELEEQRAKMNGNAGGVNKNGVKFKARQRAR